MDREQREEERNERLEFDSTVRKPFKKKLVKRLEYPRVLSGMADCDKIKCKGGKCMSGTSCTRYAKIYRQMLKILHVVSVWPATSLDGAASS